MAANKALAEQRNLSEYEIELIGKLHELWEDVASNVDLYSYEELSNTLHELEFALQKVWGFDQDILQHRRTKEVLFQKTWAGAKVKSIKTGEVFVVPKTVKYRDFFPIDNGFLDVGDGHYYRGSGVVILGDSEEELKE